MPSTASSNESRRYPRMAVDCVIDYRHVEYDQPIQGQAKNISGNGMLFLADREISVGSLLEIQVRPGNPSIPALDAVVEVVRIKSVDDGRAPRTSGTPSNFEIGAVIVSMK